MVATSVHYCIHVFILLCIMVNIFLFSNFESSHFYLIVYWLQCYHYIFLFFSGLKNDSLPETFLLKHTVAGHQFPVRFVKIVPLQVNIQILSNLAMQNIFFLQTAVTYSSFSDYLDSNFIRK